MIRVLDQDFAKMLKEPGRNFDRQPLKFQEMLQIMNVANELRCDGDSVREVREYYNHIYEILETEVMRMN